MPRLRSISALETMQLIREDKALLIDVRNRNESSELAINVLYYMHIPMHELAFSFEDIPKNRLIVLFCYKNKRSIIACKTLMESGFKNIAYMSGGLKDWILLDFPVIGNKNVGN